MVKAANFLPGTTFGRLTIQRKCQQLFNPDGSTYITWVCLCSCGKFTEARTRSLTSGATQSCGCLQKQRASEAKKKWTAAEKNLKNRWNSIMQRCYNPAVGSYPNYGGRGITVSDEWKTFENFIKDMGFPPTALHTVERMNNEGSYCKGNCCWATSAEQNRNTRQNTWIELLGNTYCLQDVAKAFNVTAGTFHIYKSRNGLDSMQEAVVSWIAKQPYARVTRSQDELFLHKK